MNPTYSSCGLASDLHFPAAPVEHCSRRACLLALGACAAWPLAARATPSPPWPQTLKLDYDVTGQARGLPYRASAQLLWHATAERYDAELTMRVRLLGTRTQRSSGRWTATGLQPKRFTDQSRSERRFEMDWAQEQFHYFRGGELMRQGALEAGTQDRLSLFFALALHTARLPDGTQPPALQLPVMSPGGVQAWTFVWTGADRVETPAGTFMTRRVQRQTLAGDDTRLSLWLYRGLGWLPVRILLQDGDGDVVDQRLRLLPRT